MWEHGYDSARCVELSPPINPCSVEQAIGGCVRPFHPSWEICSGCGTNVSCTTIFQTRLGLARGSLGEQSQTEPSRSTRPDMMVLVLMSSIDFCHAFWNDKWSTQAMTTIKIHLGNKRSRAVSFIVFFGSQGISNDCQECWIGDLAWGPWSSGVD